MDMEGKIGYVTGSLLHMLDMAWSLTASRMVSR